MKVTLDSLKNETYDYVVVGGRITRLAIMGVRELTLYSYIGGTSGCLIAARLAAAEYHVLLVEAGGDIEDDLDNLVPGVLWL